MPVCFPQLCADRRPFPPALQEVFDFDALRKFLARKDFSFVFDALHAVTGAYAEPLFVKELGAPASVIRCSGLGVLGTLRG